jgi:hypothetical protein
MIKESVFYFGVVPEDYVEQHKEEVSGDWDGTYYYRIRVVHEDEEIKIEDSYGQMVPMQFSDVKLLRSVLKIVKGDCMNQEEYIKLTEFDRKKYDADQSIVNKRIYTLESQGVPGMKDFFATSALSCLANPAVAAGWNERQIANFAYTLAEAMMIERKKRNVS